MTPSRAGPNPAIPAIEILGKEDVPGFGKFAVKNREARVGKDPRTGEEKEFPAKRVAVFRPAKPLKDALNDCDPLHIA